MASELSTGAVAELTGVSLRRLQWMDERRIVNPEVIGHRRVWTPALLLRTAVIAELRRSGCSLKEASQALIRTSRSPFFSERYIVVPLEARSGLFKPIGRRAKCLEESMLGAEILFGPVIVVNVRAIADRLRSKGVYFDGEEASRAEGRRPSGRAETEPMANRRRANATR